MINFVNNVIMLNNVNREKNITKLKTCFTCRENIGTRKWSTCSSCNIIMHHLCEEINRGEKQYCECPRCHRRGTIGCYI